MRRLNKIACGLLSLSFVMSIGACGTSTSETTSNNDNITEASETEVTETTAIETETSDSNAFESTTAEIVDSTESEFVSEETSDITEQTADTGTLLSQFKAVADTINSSNPDAVYSIRHGASTFCDELPSMDFFLCVYTENNDTYSIYDSEGNLVYEEENFGGPDYRGYYTYEAFEKSPVIIFSHDLGLGRADDVTMQTVEDYKDGVADGEYFGTVLAVSEDGKQALVSLGKAIVYSQEETEAIELSEGYWEEYEDGYIWRMEGDSGYWDTEDRVLTFIDIAPEAELAGESNFVKYLTGDYQNTYEDSVIISDEGTSILDTKFIEYSLSTFSSYEYDGWIVTSAKAAPVVISGGQITYMDLFQSAAY